MKTFSELKKNLKREIASYPKFKISLLGDTATQFLATAIKGMGVERGYNIDLFEAEYNQVERQFMDPTSDLYQFDADIIVVFQSTHKLGEHHSMLTADKQATLADDRLNFVASICENPALANKKIIYFNYAEIEDTVFGSYANKVDTSLTYQVRKLNYELMNLAQQYGNLFICDIAGLQNKFGRDFMFASNVYVSTEMILSVDALPYVASRVIDIVAAIKGQFKKCLILDLDNTVWGGVVGDDGLEGIQLGHGLGIGKAFTEFQMWVKKLKQRGIIICVASKNDEDKAKEPFEKHPDMILHLDDIAVFQANWETKVDNIRTIQSILNISFDSMVFLDDNPFERNMVRENIQGITVPELPEDPGEYLEYLYSLNLFDASSETLYGIEKKIEYISNNGKLTDVLIVADANLLKQDKPKKGHLYAISPELVHYTNFVPFHLSFFKAAIDPKLSLSIIAYKMLGRRIGSIVDDRVLSYDSIHNEVRLRLFEDEIKKGCYYNESRMKVFYQRDSIGNYSESVLGENQISLLNRINDIVRSNNARCKIVISPLYDQVKFNNRDLKILEDIFGKHSVYDFSGVNDITEDYHNYYETAHYRPKAAAYILNRVYQ